MHVLVTLRDDNEKFNTKYSFGELNKISITDGHACIFFNAPGVELGTSRAPTVFDVPTLCTTNKLSVGL
jgi:hypothetical protein